MKICCPNCGSQKFRQDDIALAMADIFHASICCICNDCGQPFQLEYQLVKLSF